MASEEKVLKYASGEEPMVGDTVVGLYSGKEPSPYANLPAFDKLCRETVAAVAPGVRVVTDVCGREAFLLWLQLPGHKERIREYRAIHLEDDAEIRADVRKITESYLRETDPRRASK